MLVEVLFCELDGRVLGGMQFGVLVEVPLCDGPGARVRVLVEVPLCETDGWVLGSMQFTLLIRVLVPATV